jgi:hypothetical protein
MSPQDILNEAVVLQGPDRVDVLNVSISEGIWVNVEGRIGLDAGAVVGVNSDPEDGLLDKIWKSLGRRGVQTLETVSVWTSTITVLSRSDPAFLLATIDIPPLQIPLTVNPPPEPTWLQPISTPILLRPTSNTSDLLRFVRDSWRNGQMLVKTEVPVVDVRGGEIAGNSWKNMLHRQLLDVKTAFSMQVPKLPGFPHPGRNTPVPPLADFITLRSFQLANDADRLIIQAVATVVDPAPMTLNATTPTFSLIVSLPFNSSLIPIASVQTDPFDLTHPNITLGINGHVLPLPPKASPALSTFLNRYLSGHSNPISITTPLVPDLTVEAKFPGPDYKPQILRNVTIHGMKVKPGSPFLVSGTVLAQIVLPKGMNIDLDVKRVLPDVLVFDGEVPEDVHTDNTPESPPLPDPLPEGAFGHIRPDDWLNSRCVSVEPEDEEGSTFAVSAKIADVPLEVLPGREKEFRNFASKIIFGNVAVAGLLGTAAVGIDVRGLSFDGPGHSDGMELSGLPFRGNVKLGKGSLYHFETAEKWNDVLHKFVPMPHH